ncbi:hypothetical protein GH714_025520 [Hevea brasiliensis]|uniref:Pre-mRNA polyadenylation factor Fip1 domain-containing protein n=1 Tax=Hevea brasiliensis TaxID=3981 RepID=A0A6A6KL65_HEVBR|nr:hypothetical protein GH714_025520 [Hevea brasiliensis]
MDHHFRVIIKVNDSLGLVCSSKSVRGDWEDNRCKQHKISNTGQVANNRAMANSSGYGFSLPWYRTILDVNIDAFEEKKWKHPGAHISDFFNFGFNEDSWKQYCISLEQLRQHSFMHGRFQNQKSSKFTQAFEIELEDERAAYETVTDDIAQAGSASKSADMGERQLELPKGRAIQVEDTTTERQPTMDLRHPRIWDSDVVIQINVQDSNGNSSGSGEEELCHIDRSGLEASKIMDLCVDDIQDVHNSGSDSVDESPAKSLGNIRSSSSNRCSQPVSDSSQMALDLGSHDKDQNSDAERHHHHHEANAQMSEEISKEMETIEEENGRICASQINI